MKTPYFVRSIFAIASILSLSWPVSAMAQSVEETASDERTIPDPPADDPIELGSDWLHRADWENNAKNVVYSAGLKKQKIDDASTSVYVITDKDIANHGWRTLAEMLRHIPGVQTVTDESQFQTVSIRSTGGIDRFNTGIVWMQDGVPLNDVHTSGIYLDETYPIELIQRIEVVTGPGAAMYGNGATQGVVHIFTKNAKDIDKYGEYRLTIQNNLTFKGSATAAYYHEDKDLGIVGHVSGNTTQGSGLIGNYAYQQYVMEQAGENVGSNQTPTFFRHENLDSNSDKHWTDVDFKLNYKSLKWNLGFQYRSSGLDGSEYHPYIAYETQKLESKDSDISKYEGVKDVAATTLQRFQRIQFYTDFIFEDKIKDDFEMRSLISYRLNRLDFNTNNTTYHKKYWIDNIFYTHQLYANAQLLWRIADNNIFTAGLSLNYQGLTLDDSDSSTTQSGFIANKGKSQHLFTPSLYIMDEHKLWQDRISLTAGLRFDAYHINAENDAYLPSAHAAFNGAFTDWMSMRLSYGFTPKSASIYQLELYQYKQEDTNIENKNIKDTFKKAANPELHHKVELAFLFKPTDFMRLNFDVYYTHIDDPILMQFVGLPMNDDSYINTYGIQNFDIPVQIENESADIAGFNLGLDTAIGEYWNLYAHYSFMFNTYSYIERMTEDDITMSEDNMTWYEQPTLHHKMHTAKLGATYINDYLTADLAFFLVGGTAPRLSYFAWKRKQEDRTYNNPFYAVFQPQISVKLPANLGLMVQGSYAFSEGMTESPTYRYYYEKEGVPVNRYSVMFSLLYPFRK